MDEIDVITKRAYLVLGPESSGTHLMTRMLINCGCLGDWDKRQHWDSAPPTDQTPIVWRRSYPYAGQWPHLSDLTGPLCCAGYNVHIVVMSRDWRCMAQSQCLAGHVRGLKQAYKNITTAVITIAQHVQMYAWVGIIYEELCRNPRQTLIWLDSMIGLPTLNHNTPIRFANTKYDARTT